MLKGIRSQRLVALFLAGIALLNFPLVSLWDKDVHALGWPLLPLGLFIVWVILIAALAWVMEPRDD